MTDQADQPVHGQDEQADQPVHGQVEQADRHAESLSPSAAKICIFQISAEVRDLQHSKLGNRWNDLLTHRRNYNKSICFRPF